MEVKGKIIIVDWPTRITDKTLGNDKLYPQVLEAIEKATGRKPLYCDREHWMFGYMQQWRFKDGGEPLYLSGNTLQTWEEVKAYLRENWRPVKQEEIDWFCNNL